MFLTVIGAITNLQMMMMMMTLCLRVSNLGELFLLKFCTLTLIKYTYLLARITELVITLECYNIHICPIVRATAAAAAAAILCCLAGVEVMLSRTQHSPV